MGNHGTPISITLWQSVLLLEEIVYPEKSTFLLQVTDKSHQWQD
jgi:hypothetical protein